MRRIKHITVAAGLAGLLFAHGAEAALAVPAYTPVAGDDANGGRVATEYRYRFSIGAFTLAPGVKYPLQCAAGDQLVTHDGKDYAAYMQDALQQELTRRGMYYASSKVGITATVESISVVTAADKSGEGNWQIIMTLTATGIKPVVMEENFPFSVTGDSKASCVEAAQNFPAAVSDVLGGFIQQYL
jgi:hypothetical protein